MKKLVITLAVLLFAVASSKSLAAEKKKALIDQVSGSGYGLAGCGLGSIVFGPKPGMIQVLAVTSNEFYGNQTTGITLGTSNCDIPEMGMTAASYIETNKEIIKKEAARGQGESIQDLAGIFKCQNQAEFQEAIHANFTEIFLNTDDSYQSSREIMKVIEQNKNLNCQKS